MLAYSGTFLLPTSWGMPNIGRTETEAMLAGVGRNHPNDHFLQIPRVDNVARCYVCELVPGLKNAMLDFTGVLVDGLHMFIKHMKSVSMVPFYPHEFPATWAFHGVHLGHCHLFQVFNLRSHGGKIFKDVFVQCLMLLNVGKC